MSMAIREKMKTVGYVLRVGVDGDQREDENCRYVLRVDVDGDRSGYVLRYMSMLLSRRGEMNGTCYG